MLETTSDITETLEHALVRYSVLTATHRLQTPHILCSAVSKSYTSLIRSLWPFYIVSECCPCMIHTGESGSRSGSDFRGFLNGCSPVCLLYGCKIAANVEKCLFVCPDFKNMAQIRFLCWPVEEIRKRK